MTAMLDLGEILRVTCAEEGPLGACVIEVVGERGSRRYSTEVILSRNRFEEANGCLLWNVRTERLLALWQESLQQFGSGSVHLPFFSQGDVIKLPSTLEAMIWAKNPQK